MSMSTLNVSRYDLRQIYFLGPTSASASTVSCIVRIRNSESEYTKFRRVARRENLAALQRLLSLRTLVHRPSTGKTHQKQGALGERKIQQSGSGADREADSDLLDEEEWRESPYLI